MNCLLYILHFDGCNKHKYIPRSGYVHLLCTHIVGVTFVHKFIDTLSDSGELSQVPVNCLLHCILVGGTILV